MIDDHQTLDQITDGEMGSRFFLELDARDQALCKAIALTTLRHQRRISIILSKVYNRKPPQKARFLIHALHVAAAQILFMEVPSSAAVNLAISMIRSERRTDRFGGFANAVLRNLERRRDELLEKTADAHPFPDWMFKKLTTDHGKEKILKSGVTVSKQTYIDLTLKKGTELSKEISALSLPMGSYRLLENTAIHDLPGFEEGTWWVQDIAASLPVKLLGPIKGLQVADLCAAPGGKTMQLADAGAKVTAIDQSEKRLSRLKSNLDRVKLEANLVMADILEFESEIKFDAVLLDAPCTATGTLRKHPDVLWNKTPADVETLSKLQADLIKKSLDMLKSGGVLIYANCSLLKDEGENLVHKLKLENCVLDKIKPEELPGLKNCINGQGTVRCLPHLLTFEDKIHSTIEGMDGFFIARFIKI